MRLRAFGFVIAIEEYGKAAQLGHLDGVLNDAARFVDWLIDVRGAAPADVFACTAPRSLARQGLSGNRGARRDDIRDTAKALATVAVDQPSDLFVWWSGHGGRRGSDDVFLAEDFEWGDGGHGIRLRELETTLLDLGPGTNYWFVDACRTDVDFTVPELDLPIARSKKGSSIPNELYSTVENSAARAVSRFPSALTTSLSGAGRAKQPIGTTYWVTFPRVVDVVHDAVAAEGTSIDPWPARAFGQILELHDVPDTEFSVDVHGAQTGEHYELSLGSGERDILHYPFIWPPPVLAAPPGDYRPELEFDGQQLQRLTPPAGEPVDLYATATLVFTKGDAKAPVANPAPTPVTMLPPTSPHVAIDTVHDGNHFQLNMTSAPRTYHVTDEPVAYTVTAWGEPVAKGYLGADAAGEHSIPDLVSTRGWFDHVLPSQRAAAQYVDLMPSAPAQPIVDVNASALLALMGASSICDRAPYEPLIAPMNTFDDLEPGASAVYVLTTLPDVRLGIDLVGDLEHAESFGDLGVSHWSARLGPGDCFLRIVADGVDLTVATRTFAGRITLVTIAIDDSAIDPVVQQFALRPAVTPEAAATAPSVLEDIAFSCIVQRRFRARVPVLSEAADDHHLAPWRRLVRCEWPDPITVLIYGFELVRRGALADTLNSPLKPLVSYFATTYGTGSADFAILRALHNESDLPTDGTPLLLDALLARGAPADRVSAGDLDYRGPFAQWQRWTSTQQPARALATELT